MWRKTHMLACGMKATFSNTLATQNRHLKPPKKTALDEAIATDIAINIIAIQYLKLFFKKLLKMLQLA